MENTLNRFYSKVYALLAIGLITVAVTTTITIANYIDKIPLILAQLGKHPFIFSIVFIAIITVMSGFTVYLANKKNPLTFAGYGLVSIIFGLYLSLIVPFFSMQDVMTALLSTVAVLVAMSAVGRFSKYDFSKLGRFCFNALIALIVVSLIGVFLHSSLFNIIISLVSALLFSILIAVDSKEIENVYNKAPKNADYYAAISSSLQLELDAINLFINLLNLLGSDD